MIKKENKKYFEYSEDGKKLSEGYDTEKEAQERLDQIEYFKNVDLEDVYKDEDFQDAEYQGKEVTLNKPFRTHDESKKFAVYVKDGETVKIVRFGDPDMEIKRDDPEARANFRARHNCDEKTDRTKAGYWSCKFWSSKNVSDLTDGIIFKDSVTKTFKDKDSKKTIVSIRDGVHEYLGGELGMTPIDKIFTVYRSPDTIKSIAPTLIDLPLSNEHLDYDKLPKSLEEGRILTSEIKDFIDEDTDTTLLVENEISLDDNMLKLVKDGKDELSLDYSGKLIPHDKYDFEQVEVVPKFLAIVNNGRCGKQCSFKDKQGAKMTLKEIMDAIKSLGEKEKFKLYDAMKPKETEEMIAVSDMEKKMEDMKGEVVEEFKDSQCFKDAMKPKETEEMIAVSDMEKKMEDMKGEVVEEFKDSQCFKDAMMNFADERANTIEKAKSFLPEDYDYKGKANDVIMKDALKAEKKDIEFKDSEISTAFKMLEKVEATNELQNFADGKNDDKWSKLANKKIGDK